PDGLAPEETLDLLRQLQGAAVALVRFLPEAFEADGLKIPRDVRLEAGHRHRLGVQHLQDGFQWRLPPEGRPTGQQFVEDGPESIDVCGRTHWLAGSRSLFGCHVTGCAQALSCDGGIAMAGRPPAVGAPGHAEVGNLGLVRGEWRAVSGRRALGPLTI